VSSVLNGPVRIPIAIGGFAIIALAANWLKEEPATSAKPAEYAAQERHSAGTEGVLRSIGGREFVFGFPSKERLLASARAAVANDLTGYTEAVSEAMVLEPGTRVLVLMGGTLGLLHVRIMGGPFAGQDAWIHVEEFRRVP